MDTEEVEATVEDIEEDPLATDNPPHVLFANHCLCAQGMGTEEEEAIVEDIEEDPLATYIYPSACIICVPRGRVWRLRP